MVFDTVTARFQEREYVGKERWHENYSDRVHASATAGWLRNL